MKVKHGTIELYCKPFFLNGDTLFSNIYEAVHDISGMDVCYGDYWSLSILVDGKRVLSTSLNSYSCVENISYIQSVCLLLFA